MRSNRGTYSDWQTSLTPIIIWSAALIFGPSGLWLAVIHSLIYYIRRWRKFPSVERRWNCARNFTFNLVEVLTSLIAITLYANWAGSTTPKSAFPLPDLTLGSILPAPSGHVHLVAAAGACLGTFSVLFLNTSEYSHWKKIQ